MKILVLGATGNIGANIVTELLKKGNKVKALVRSIPKANKILPKECEFIEGDIVNQSSIEVAMKDCEIVYHAAGLPEQWFSDTEIFNQVNHIGTKNVVEAALKSKIKRLVYTSTIDVFEAKSHQEYDESIIDINPKGTPYERSKQAADIAVVDGVKRGLDAVFLHPSGVYGPGPGVSPGTNDLIRDLILGKVPMLLPGGFPVVFAKDCAIGHILAAEKAKSGERFILSDSYFSLLDFTKLVSEVQTLKRIPAVMPLWLAKLFSSAGELKAKMIKSPPLLPSGQLHFLQWQAVPVANKAKHELGWKITETKEGIRQTIEFLGLSKK